METKALSTPAMSRLRGGKSLTLYVSPEFRSEVQHEADAHASTLNETLLSAVVCGRAACESIETIVRASLMILGLHEQITDEAGKAELFAMAKDLQACADKIAASMVVPDKKRAANRQNVRACRARKHASNAHTNH